MRSVVLRSSPRCPRCFLPLRWCVCAAHREASCVLDIDVLMHHRERFRPSSTGNLINRIIPASRHHLWRRERRLTAAEVCVSGRELWILHPHGEPAPFGETSPADVQVLLIDGSWREASAITQEIGSWGRLVSVPMAGQSRYWLRTQADDARFSTVETLLFVLQSFGLRDAHDALRLQFELHVYASLRARGRKTDAVEFLASSPIAAEFPDLIAELDRPRRRE